VSRDTETSQMGGVSYQGSWSVNQSKGEKGLNVWAISNFSILRDVVPEGLTP
jgi:hypothetical protein